jgi:nicotinate-nucleotide adenylyltransferase
VRRRAAARHRPDAYRPYATGIAFLRAAWHVADGAARWRSKAYEFVADIPAIDLLTGDARARALIEAGAPLPELIATWAEAERAFIEETSTVPAVSGRGVTIVGLLGGAFNPPHVAHALVGLYALETQAIDRLWLVPTWKNAFGKHLAPYDDRVAMCELVAAALGIGPRCRASRRTWRASAAARAGRCTRSSTWRSWRRRWSFRLIIGADILLETSAWLAWDEVCRRAPPIVIGRGGVAAPPGATVSEVAMPAVSSTEVRRRLGVAEDARDLLPAAVLRYIDARGLYR